MWDVVRDKIAVFRGAYPKVYTILVALICVVFAEVILSSMAKWAIGDEWFRTLEKSLRTLVIVAAITGVVTWAVTSRRSPLHGTTFHITTCKIRDAMAAFRRVYDGSKFIPGTRKYVLAVCGVLMGAINTNPPQAKVFPQPTRKVLGISVAFSLILLTILIAAFTKPDSPASKQPTEAEQFFDYVCKMERLAEDERSKLTSTADELVVNNGFERDMALKEVAAAFVCSDGARSSFEPPFDMWQRHQRLIVTSPGFRIFHEAARREGLRIAQIQRFEDEAKRLNREKGIDLDGVFAQFAEVMPQLAREFAIPK